MSPSRRSTALRRWAGLRWPYRRGVLRSACPRNSLTSAREAPRMIRWLAALCLVSWNRKPAMFAFSSALANAVRIWPRGRTSRLREEPPRAPLRIGLQRHQGDMGRLPYGHRARLVALGPVHRDPRGGEVDVLLPVERENLLFPEPALERDDQDDAEVRVP